ncbi:MAG: DeoR/GlpR family DNA-binding transcription regulator [Pseudomonadota bacterium]
MEPSLSKIDGSDVSPRQADILQIARQFGRVDVERLASRFDMTPQTIRRDLNDLCDRGLLRRVHGGATYPTSITNVAYGSRQNMAFDAKRRIAARAAALIPDRSSIMLNIGTTTEEVARALIGHQGIMVVTNNLNVAHILREAPSAEVIIAGGLVRASDGGIVGEATVDFIRQFKMDYAVIGASAVDPDGTLLDYDYREVSVAREILAQARHTLLVADSMKFERRAPVRIGHLSELDVFVTDIDPPASISQICKDYGVTLEIADGNGILE